MLPQMARLATALVTVSADLSAAVCLAVEKLKAGKVIAVPTDTVYGLAAAADNTNAINLLYKIKARDLSNPIAVCVSQVSHLNVKNSIKMLCACR